MKLVNTIGRYVPKELKEDIDKVSRFDIPFADITGKEKDWKVIAN